MPDSSVPPLHIRAASPEDARAISELVSPLTLKFIAAECSAQTRQKLLATMSPEAIRGSLLRGYRYHVGEVDRRVVGVVGTSPPDCRPGQPHVHLHHLFVAEAQHGNGYATCLWDRARENSLAASLPGEAVEFTVNASLYAYAIYCRWGFLPRGERRIDDGIVAIPMGWRTGTPSLKNTGFLPDSPPA